jgi:hypothetical protein
MPDMLKELQLTIDSAVRAVSWLVSLRRCLNMKFLLRRRSRSCTKLPRLAGRSQRPSQWVSCRDVSPLCTPKLAEQQGAENILSHQLHDVKILNTSGKVDANKYAHGKMRRS